MIILKKRSSGFLIKCLSLFIIPSNEVFFDLIEEEKFNNWFIYGSYAYNTVFLPFSLILTMIIIRHPDIEDKYRTPKLCCKFNYFYFFELIDVICQFVYAILWQKI